MVDSRSQQRAKRLLEYIKPAGCEKQVVSANTLFEIPRSASELGATFFGSVDMHVGSTTTVMASLASRLSQNFRHPTTAQAERRSRRRN
jgi:hypothetical protein